ncbi:MAG: IS30 family transposase [Selenomonadaceae bacterium]|nr:IS30 family transposase [Selenomonadaceae bacterium]
MYKAKRGQDAYKKHRKRSRRPCKLDKDSCEPFIQWLAKMVRTKRWSLDACVGYARLNHLFETPHILGRKGHRKWNRKNKRMKGRSIEERPDIVVQGTEIGHWEVDTVVGQREGREAVAFTAVEKVTRNYIAIRISGRTCAGVDEAMQQLHEMYGEHFGEVFKTMTADNGPEFEKLSTFERLGTKVYFTHPYSSWERPQNEPRVLA